MNEKYYVLLSLAVVIVLGVAMDTVISGNSEQDEKISTELANKNFTNIKIFGKYKGSGCESLEIKRRFQAEQNGKIAYGSACTTEKGENTVVKVESLGYKPDPTKLIN